MNKQHRHERLVRVRDSAKHLAAFLEVFLQLSLTFHTLCDSRHFKTTGVSTPTDHLDASATGQTIAAMPNTNSSYYSKGTSILTFQHAADCSFTAAVKMSAMQFFEQAVKYFNNILNLGGLKFLNRQRRTIRHILGQHYLLTRH